jgi:hypothetical protein
MLKLGIIFGLAGANLQKVKMEQFRRFLVFALAGWSGCFVMAVELLSGRILAPNFGNSIYVWGGVITVFMLALSVGYLLGGHLSVHTPSLRRLGYLLLAAAVATLPVVFWGDALLDWIFELVRDPRYGSLLASSALFFLPTAISGTVSPYAIRLLVKQLHVSGKSAGSLYFVSTFGSAVGTICTSFYLVLWFEINQIFVGMIGISVLLAITAIIFGGLGNDEK